MAELIIEQEEKTVSRLVTNWLKNKATQEQINYLKFVRDNTPLRLSGQIAKLMDMGATMLHAKTFIHPKAWHQYATDTFYKHYPREVGT